MFRAVSSHVGKFVRRVTGGETGVRSNWTFWQRAEFDRTPGLVTDEVHRGE
ncbi:hypothetical protein QRX50_21720 [Amycolatopsis carbonis]|uniref:Uncharacterized protein n=1 Tax=Amycolatopsis carbonis TaxID=715471 RepID=A0A9Y2INI8_9PSEU|nr:hypothetical protein [Amycolatopsis sp. 2-15]WIX83189.1 hypothetical protein QRX50_21720 [Amycolatopsis sp. 2-15]